jgi:hypothetical protein
VSSVPYFVFVKVSSFSFKGVVLRFLCSFGLLLMFC